MIDLVGKILGVKAASECMYWRWVKPCKLGSWGSRFSLQIRYNWKSEGFVP
jgi:hypothetical protein